MSAYEDQFCKVLNFLRVYESLIDCHLVDFLTEDLWEKCLPKDLKVYLEKRGPDVISEIKQFDKANLCHDSELYEFLKDAESLNLEHCQDTLTRHHFLNIVNKAKTQSLKPLQSEFMKVKKWHEVEVFTKTVAWLNQGQSCIVIDAGAGKGYSSLHLANYYNFPVLAIECSQINHKGAILHRDLVNKKSKQSTSLINYAVKQIDETTDFVQLAKDHYPDFYPEELKRAMKGAKVKIHETEPSDNSDPELAWVLKMQHSGVLTGLKKITLPKPSIVSQQNQSVHTNLEVSRDKQSVQTTGNVKSNSTLREDSVDKNVVNKKPTASKKNSLLSPTVIQKLLEFPIVETYKSPDDKWSSDFKIMSLSAMEERSCLKYPSVTRILSATMTEEAKAVLERWKMNMIEKLGERGFELYQAELLSDGKMLHSTIMNRLTDKPYEVPERVKNAFKSLDNVLEGVDGVRAIESHVIHPTLLYRGIVDCVAVYRGNLCCIDWKKSDKAKNTLGSTYDAPLQLASYIGALNADLKYPFQIKKGLIIVAYTNGDPATVHEISEESLQLYWRLWLQRLQEYHIALNT